MESPNARLRAELAALKAQEPVAELLRGQSAIGTWFDLNVFDQTVPNGTKLYAAPVSEAKAQGVVMPERLKPSRYELHDAAVDAWNSCLDEVARLNSAPIQQVSVPDGWRELAKRADDFLYSLQETDSVLRLRADLCTMLAAPAAPAADAGHVFYGMDGNHP